MSSNTNPEPHGATSAHGQNLAIPDSLLPRPESPLAQGPFTHVPRPLHTDMLVPFNLEAVYLNVVNEIATMNLDSDKKSLLWAIHRLSGLHVAKDNCVLVNACLERMIEFELIRQNFPLTHDQNSNIRGLLDMCLFLHYAPLVKRDINGLPSGHQKDVLMRLFLAICPGGHTVE
ncbi:hypothetical protein N7488_012268 [Penicillium malachiteum]|nr:hypothetical protein N7488_012268 [Penicillium malachiteum]